MNKSFGTGELLANESAISVMLLVGFRSMPGEAAQGIMSARLAWLLEGLAGDFGFRLELDLTFEVTDIDIAPAPFRLHINGSEARIPLENPNVDDAAARADQIFEAVFENRSLLVNEAMASAFATQVSGPDATMVAHHRMALEMALSRCLNVTAAEHCFVGLERRGATAQPDETELDYPAELALARQSYPQTIVLEVGRNLLDAGSGPADEEAERTVSEQRAAWMRAELAMDLGLFFPPIEVRFCETLEGDEFRVRMNHIRGPILQGLGMTERIVEASSVDKTVVRSLERNPLDGREMAVVAAADAETVQGLVMTPIDHAMLLVHSVLLDHAALFCSVRHVEHLLARPNVMTNTLRLNLLSRHSVLDVLHVFRALLSEKISLRNMRAICEGLLLAGPTLAVDRSRLIVFSSVTATHAPGQSEKDRHSLAELVEAARQSMKPYISFKHSKGSTLIVILLDPEIEETLIQGQPIPAAQMRFLFSEIIGSLELKRDLAILTTTTVRAHFRALVEVELPGLPVLAYEELSPETNIQPLYRLTLD